MGSPSGTRARVAPSPSRGGKGGYFFCFLSSVTCTNLFHMNLDAIVGQLSQFFSDGIGKIIADFLWSLYTILFPANAPGATPVEIPN
mgnify:CR=1 FL=1